MKIDTIMGRAVCLLHVGGRTTLLDDLAAGLLVDIKSHGHYGNVTHHVSAGDWAAVSSALCELLALPCDRQGLSPLAKNLVGMLEDRGPPSLRPFRGWLLDRVERQTTNLYRRSLERRIDVLSDELRTVNPVLRKAALRILADSR